MRRARTLAETDPSFAGPPPRSPGFPAIDLAGIACFVAGAMVFAAAIARRSGIHSRWWMLGAPLIQSVGVALWGFAIGVVFLWLQVPQVLPYVQGLAMLTIAAALFVVSVFWHRSPEPDVRT